MVMMYIAGLMFSKNSLYLKNIPAGEADDMSSTCFKASAAYAVTLFGCCIGLVRDRSRAKRRRGSMDDVGGRGESEIETRSLLGKEGGGRSEYGSQ